MLGCFGCGCAAYKYCAAAGCWCKGTPTIGYAEEEPEEVDEPEEVGEVEEAVEAVEAAEAGPRVNPTMF